MVQDIGSVAKDVSVILSCLVMISGLIYWAIRAKLRDEFCMKKDCKEKHDKLEAESANQRKDNSEELKEIKDMVKEIRGWMFDFITNNKMPHKE